MTEPVGLAPIGLSRGSHQLRRSRFCALFAALVRPLDGLFDGYAGAAGRWHRRHLFRLQQLPPAFPRTDRGSQTRRLGNGRVAADVSDDLARRSLSQSDEPDVPQSDGDRHRGDDPRPADGCGGVGRRLRQDGAGAANGRDFRQPPGDPARRRADDDRALAWRAARRLHRLPPLLGPLPGRRDRTRRKSRRSKAISQQPPGPAR